MWFLEMKNKKIHIKIDETAHYGKCIDMLASMLKACAVCAVTGDKKTWDSHNGIVEVVETA